MGKYRIAKEFEDNTHFFTIYTVVKELDDGSFVDVFITFDEDEAKDFIVRMEANDG